MNRIAVIIGNGELPVKRLWNTFLVEGNYKVSADGGLKHFLHYGSVPDLLIGDLDSIPEAILDKYMAKVKTVKISRQTDTDMDKAIKYLLKRGFKDITLLAATGKRLDHFLANMGLLAKYHNRAAVRIISNHSVIQAYSSSTMINAAPGETISLYAISGSPVVSTSGLQYLLMQDILTCGGKESTSNIAEQERVTIDISGGILLVVRQVNPYLRTRIRK
ncbi:MAG: thiamine diphosphokinase [Ignavibacteriales bacterium]|nr:thiamine diphosphokinase [Ignavibacteriales bacterium]